MTGLFDRLGAAFVAPRSAEAPAGPRGAPVANGRERPQEAARRSGPTTVAVLSRPEDALVAGGAVALLLASRSRASHALLAVWRGGEPPVRAPATGAARRLAATLASRGHESAATGRLAVVQLGGELCHAAPEAVRALAVAQGVPGVVVLAGARDDSADDLLRAQDRVLVVAAPDAASHVAELALTGLASLGIAAGIVELPAVAAPARTLAASGVGVAPPLRAAVATGVEGAAVRSAAEVAALHERPEAVG